MPVHACTSHHCTAFRVPRPCLQAPPWLCSTPRQGSAAETSPTLTSRRYVRRYPAHSPANSTRPLAGIALRVATHTGASIPDSVRIMCRLRGRACKTHARSVCTSRSRPACSRNSRSAHACGMEQHEILDAMHETIARSYLDLEIVLEDFMFVLLSIRFYMRIVALHGHDDPVCICGLFANLALCLSDRRSFNSIAAASASACRDFARRMTMPGCIKTLLPLAV